MSRVRSNNKRKNTCSNAKLKSQFAYFCPVIHRMWFQAKEKKSHQDDKSLKLLIIISLHLSGFTLSAKCHEINLQKANSQIAPVYTYSETKVSTEERWRKVGKLEGELQLLPEKGTAAPIQQSAFSAFKAAKNNIGSGKIH